MKYATLNSKNPTCYHVYSYTHGFIKTYFDFFDAVRRIYSGATSPLLDTYDCQKGGYISNDRGKILYSKKFNQEKIKDIE